MQFRSVLLAATLGLTVAACAEVREVRLVGSYDDPLCAPDGSVVLGVLPNSAGNYQPVMSNTANCPWHQEPRAVLAEGN
jgi:hypothetical protein